MDFIVENYLWFGITGVILLMALIGFLAEKTDFITGAVDSDLNDKKKKKKKQKNDDSFDKKIVEEPLFGSETSDNNSSEVLDFANTGMSNAEPTIKAAPLSIDDPWMQPEPVLTEDDSVITETGEDLSQPFGDQETTVDTNNSVENSNEDVSADSSEEVSSDNGEVISSDEDVWKF